MDEVVSKYAPAVEARLVPLHAAAGVGYPPDEIALIATKKERKLEVWVRDTGAFRRIRTYKVRGLSGSLGPKLRRGDRQVPEGVYRIVSLNPNSRFHLSLELNYPNAFDRARAAKEGRRNLGGDIFIHGGSASVGCLAMGDAVIEELFVLVAHTGRERVRVIIAPEEPEGSRFPSRRAVTVPWASELHAAILSELNVVRGQADA